MIKVSQEKTEFNETPEIIFWDEDKQKYISPSLVLGLLALNKLKIIRKFVSRHNEEYMTYLDYDFYVVPVDEE